MMGTEIFKIDATWAEKLTKTRVQFLMTPTVSKVSWDWRRPAPRAMDGRHHGQGGDGAATRVL